MHIEHSMGIPCRRYNGGYNRPYPGGVASRLATIIYVAMIMPILCDNLYSPNNSNLKYESDRLYG